MQTCEHFQNVRGSSVIKSFNVLWTCSSHDDVLCPSYFQKYKKDMLIVWIPDGSTISDLVLVSYFWNYNITYVVRSAATKEWSQVSAWIPVTIMLAAVA